MKEVNIMLIENKALEQISGSGKRWTSAELSTLKGLISSGKYYSSETLEGYDWDKIAKDLNAEYHNDRTANTCKNQFYSRGADNWFLEN